MTPILGIWASSIAKVTGSYESIATVTASSGSIVSATFSNIPSTYAHLQIRGIGRTTGAGSSSGALRLTFNSDTGSNYVSHLMYGDGGTAGAVAYTAETFTRAGGFIPNTSATADVFGGFVTDILDYANTNKYKTVRCLTGADFNNTNGNIYLVSGLWQNTNAVTSITLQILTSAGYDLAQYSHIALYGIKAA